MFYYNIFKMYYIILFLIFILFKILRSYRRVRMYDNFDNHDIYSKEMVFSKYYDIKLENLFENYPMENSGLVFGFICPGAMKTLKHLNDNSKDNKDKEITTKISKLTDFQFLIEIVVIYKNYVKDKSKLKELETLLDGKHCEYSKEITKEISRLFRELSLTVSVNIPDNFYHIRHNTLICSNDQKLADERINLLISMYGKKKEKKKVDELCEHIVHSDRRQAFRFGKSGCEDCCRDKDDRDACLAFCMGH